MIYTLTLNPAIDLFIKTQTMAPNTVNRTDSYDIQANGKGVNVSCILKRRGVDNVALGVGGGFTLDYIADFLTEQGIRNHFYKDAGLTRINVFTRVVSDHNEYKLVNPGPEISAETLKQLYQQLTTLGADDWLCVSGSFARGIEPSFLLQLGKLSRENGFALIIDSSYPEAVKALAYHTMLGTFLAGLYQKQDLADTLKLAIAAGSDTARRAWITDFTETDELLTQIEIKKLEG